MHVTDEPSIDIHIQVGVNGLLPLYSIAPARWERNTPCVWLPPLTEDLPRTIPSLALLLLLRSRLAAHLFKTPTAELSEQIEGLLRFPRG